MDPTTSSPAALQLHCTCCRLRFADASVELDYRASHWRTWVLSRSIGLACLTAVGLAAALDYERLDYGALPQLLALLLLARALPLALLALLACGGARSACAWSALVAPCVALYSASFSLHALLCSAAVLGGGAAAAAVSPACAAFAASSAASGVLLPWLPACVALALAPLLLAAALGAPAPACAAASLVCAATFCGCCLPHAAAAGVASAVTLGAASAAAATAAAASLDARARRDWQRAAALRRALHAAVEASLATAVLRGQTLRLLGTLRAAPCAVSEVSATGAIVWALPPPTTALGAAAPLQLPSRGAAAVAARASGAVGSDWLAGGGIHPPDVPRLREAVQTLARAGATQATLRGHRALSGGAGAGSAYYSGDASLAALAPRLHCRLRFRRPTEVDGEGGGALTTAEVDMYAVLRPLRLCPDDLRGGGGLGGGGGGGGGGFAGEATALAEQTSVLIIERDITYASDAAAGGGSG